MPGDALRAGARLRKDAARLARDPVPYVKAMPLPSNILEWHYLLQGPEDSPYAGGFYHGKLIFPSDYPFKPPSIYIITPNGRFKPNTRLCLSISDFHPDTWNPTWSKQKLARRSILYNLQSAVVRDLFPEEYETMKMLAGDDALEPIEDDSDDDVLLYLMKTVLNNCNLVYLTLKCSQRTDFAIFEANPPPGLLFRIAICKSERVLAPALPVHDKVKFHNPEHHPDFGSQEICILDNFSQNHFAKMITQIAVVVFLPQWKMDESDAGDLLLSNGKFASPKEIILFTLIAHSSVLLRSSILLSMAASSSTSPHRHYFFLLCKHNLWLRFLVDYCCLILPTVLAVSIFRDSIGSLLACMLTVSLALLYVGNVGSTAIVPSGRVQLLLSGQFSDHHSVTITYFRSYVFVATSVCILAVDFGTFPKRFCKTEQFGYSLMDVGVGMFTFANGLVSPVARMRTPKLCKELKNAMLLATIGLARLVFVRWSGYAVNETEYGADWNFFFTLASLKITVELVVVVCVLPVGCTLAAAALLAVGYEFALQFAGLEAYLLEAFSTRRRTFFSLNREGLHSLFGYASLYLVGVHVGRLLFNFRWLPSRRLANASYVIWMCFLCIFDTLSIFVLVFIVQCLYMSIPAVCRNQSDVEWNWIFGSCLWTSINKHGLLYFLLSNVITGLVNMTVETKTFNASASLVILVTYSFLSSLPFALPPTGVMLAKC
ncbi:Ubiquitin-conjugating enzyme E2 J2 [Trichinella nelsoni]|uniref:Ubiquitin-conjugating enzyme E2 J2 n=1 Tax=Trichinella nelsoni TaxID=6336 RepID=A0A0V0RN78_9BILA|nr:Ubiquitin-conjugating enzyme E2 J2 [Trichinella nelsoni]